MDDHGFQNYIYINNLLLKIDNDNTPTQYSLSQNFPNPFNPITTIRYNFLKKTFVKITVFDISGNVVKTLVNKTKSAGFNIEQWNATNKQGQIVSAGVYFYTIYAGDFVDTKKMILLK